MENYARQNNAPVKYNQILSVNYQCDIINVHTFGEVSIAWIFCCNIYIISVCKVNSTISDL